MDGPRLPACLLALLLLSGIPIPASLAAGAPVPLHPLETFLAAHRDAIAGECDFTGRKSDVVHEAAWARFRGAVERRLRRDGSDTLRTRWEELAALAHAALGRAPEFPGLLRSYVSVRYETDLHRAVRELVRCRTVGDTALAVTEHPAFRRSTAVVDSLARAHGFEFEVLADGLALEVAFGAGPDTLGIWGHLDVVPADTAGWSVDPWAGVFRDDGVLEARGVLDDKGPFAASLFALRALRDTGVPLARRVVLFGGYAEETTFAGIDGYLNARPVPSTNVVIDGAFPVVIAEKGLTTITVSSSFRRAPLRLCRTGYIVRGLSGGRVTNQVPDHAEVRLYAADKLPNQAFYQVQRKVREFSENNSRARLTVARDGDEIVVSAAGRAAHASTPKEGRNAIVDLVQFLFEFGATCANPPHWVSMFVNEFIREEVNGRGLGIAMTDSLMGSTTVNVGRIGMEGDSAYVQLDIRFPRGLTPEQITTTIRERIADFDARFSAGLGVFRRGAGLQPVFVNAETELVRSLLASYEEVYREPGAPVSIAGTTYAKRLPNAVSFGPSPPGEVRAHASGEFMTRTELDDLLRVYATAFHRLAASF